MGFPAESGGLSRSVLDEKLKELEQRFGDDDIPVPDFWGGYRVRPELLSFGRGDLADCMIELVIRVSVIRVQESHGNGYVVRHDHRTPSDCSDMRVKENFEEA